ncbi:MAG: alanine racemase [Clostridia bacterium]|nr:alanine racemase [Clostridia bacterium]
MDLIMNTRTWAEINLDALTENIKEIRRITNKDSMIMAVVKADAYGHGAVECAKTLLDNGADRLAVACLDEAIQLRHSGISAPILILGASFDEEIPELIEYDITPTVFSIDFAEKLSCEAKKQGKNALIHIKLDTGMTRIGYVAGVCDEDITDEIIAISKLDNIIVEGIFSHLSTSDEKDPSYTLLQFERFMKVCGIIEKKGLKIPVKHIANSAAIMMYPQMHLEMVRAGIILYGFYPSDDVDKTKLKLKKVMTLKSRITRIEEISDNRGVSYGKTYITKGKTKVATVAIGYADGYTRMLSGKAKVEVRGQIVDVIGRICMDQCMIDVTNVNNINVGDEVIIFGADTVTADSLAMWLGTINYEIICMISKRIPRVYITDGRTVNSLNYLSKL